MIADFVLEIVGAMGIGATITLPGSSPAGRRTWASAFVVSQPFVFYVLDDSIQQEWGVGALIIGAPSTITRPTVVLGNSAGTTSRLNFATNPRCYSGLPSAAAIGTIASRDPRNILHNGRDTVAQRGLGPWTTGLLYTVDRWFLSRGSAGGTGSLNVSTLADADRTAIGDEEAQYALNHTFSGGSAAGDYDQIAQRIESVRRLAGKTVTASFWAKAAAGTPKLGLNIVQVFGTGGSPSANVLGTAQTVTLSTTWTRYALTFNIPSVTGKTFGTNAGTDFTQLEFFYSSGTTTNVEAGSIGVQAGTVAIFGRQLEFGAFPTPLEKQDTAATIIPCMRFYFGGTADIRGYNTAGAYMMHTIGLPVTMRAAPSLVFSASGALNATGVTIAAQGQSAVAIYATATATGAMSITGTFTATADL